MQVFWVSTDKNLKGTNHNDNHIANDQHVLTSTTLTHRHRKQIIVWGCYPSYCLYGEYVLSS